VHTYTHLFTYATMQGAYDICAFFKWIPSL